MDGISDQIRDSISRIIFSMESLPPLMRHSLHTSLQELSKRRLDSEPEKEQNSPNSNTNANAGNIRGSVEPSTIGKKNFRVVGRRTSTTLKLNSEKVQTSVSTVDNKSHSLSMAKDQVIQSTKSPSDLWEIIISMLHRQKDQENSVMNKYLQSIAQREVFLRTTPSLSISVSQLTGDESITGSSFKEELVRGTPKTNLPFVMLDPLQLVRDHLSFLERTYGYRPYQMEWPPLSPDSKRTAIPYDKKNLLALLSKHEPPMLLDTPKSCDEEVSFSSSLASKNESNSYRRVRKSFAKEGKKVFRHSIDMPGSSKISLEKISGCLPNSHINVVECSIHDILILRSSPSRVCTKRVTYWNRCNGPVRFRIEPITAAYVTLTPVRSKKASHSKENTLLNPVTTGLSISFDIAYSPENMLTPVSETELRLHYTRDWNKPSLPKMNKSKDWRIPFGAVWHFYRLPIRLETILPELSIKYVTESGETISLKKETENDILLSFRDNDRMNEHSPFHEDKNSDIEKDPSTNIEISSFSTLFFAPTLCGISRTQYLYFSNTGSNAVIELILTDSVFHVHQQWVEVLESGTSRVAISFTPNYSKESSSAHTIYSENKIKGNITYTGKLFLLVRETASSASPVLQKYYVPLKGEKMTIDVRIISVNGISLDDSSYKSNIVSKIGANRKGFFLPSVQLPDPILGEKGKTEIVVSNRCNMPFQYQWTVYNINESKNVSPVTVYPSNGTLQGESTTSFQVSFFCLTRLPIVAELLLGIFLPNLEDNNNDNELILSLQQVDKIHDNIALSNKIVNDSFFNWLSLVPELQKTIPSRIMDKHVKSQVKSEEDKINENSVNYFESTSDLSGPNEIQSLRKPFLCGVRLLLDPILPKVTVFPLCFHDTIPVVVNTRCTEKFTISNGSPCYVHFWIDPLFSQVNNNVGKFGRVETNQSEWLEFLSVDDANRQEMDAQYNHFFRDSASYEGKSSSWSLQFSPRSGTIPPNSSLEITCFISLYLSGVQCISFMCFIKELGLENSPVLTWNGEGVLPRIVIQEPILDFGLIRYPLDSTCWLTIRNPCSVGLSLTFRKKYPDSNLSSKSNFDPAHSPGLATESSEIQSTLSCYRFSPPSCIIRPQEIMKIQVCRTIMENRCGLFYEAVEILSHDSIVSTLPTTGMVERLALVLETPLINLGRVSQGYPTRNSLLVRNLTPFDVPFILKSNIDEGTALNIATEGIVPSRTQQYNIPFELFFNKLIPQETTIEVHVTDDDPLICKIICDKVEQISVAVHLSLPSPFTYNNSLFRKTTDTDGEPFSISQNLKQKFPERDKCREISRTGRKRNLTSKKNVDNIMYNQFFNSENSFFPNIVSNLESIDDNRLLTSGTHRPLLFPLASFPLENMFYGASPIPIEKYIQELLWNIVSENVFKPSKTIESVSSSINHDKSNSIHQKIELQVPKNVFNSHCEGLFLPYLEIGPSLPFCHISVVLCIQNLSLCNEEFAITPSRYNIQFDDTLNFSEEKLPIPKSGVSSKTFQSYSTALPHLNQSLHAMPNAVYKSMGLGKQTNKKFHQATNDELTLLHNLPLLRPMIDESIPWNDVHGESSYGGNIPVFSPPLSKKDLGGLTDSQCGKVQHKISRNTIVSDTFSPNEPTYLEIERQLYDGRGFATWIRSSTINLSSRSIVIIPIHVMANFPGSYEEIIRVSSEHLPETHIPLHATIRGPPIVFDPETAGLRCIPNQMAQLILPTVIHSHGSSKRTFRLVNRSPRDLDVVILPQNTDFHFSFSQLTDDSAFVTPNQEMPLGFSVSPKELIIPSLDTKEITITFLSSSLKLENIDSNHSDINKKEKITSVIQEKEPVSKYSVSSVFSTSVIDSKDESSDVNADLWLDDSQQPSSFNSTFSMDLIIRCFPASTRFNELFLIDEFYRLNKDRFPTERKLEERSSFSNGYIRPQNSRVDRLPLAIPQVTRFDMRSPPQEVTGLSTDFLSRKSSPIPHKEITPNLFPIVSASGDDSNLAYHELFSDEKIITEKNVENDTNVSFTSTPKITKAPGVNKLLDPSETPQGQIKRFSSTTSKSADNSTISNLMDQQMEQMMLASFLESRKRQMAEEAVDLYTPLQLRAIVKTIPPIVAVRPRVISIIRNSSSFPIHRTICLTNEIGLLVTFQISIIDAPCTITHTTDPSGQIIQPTQFSGSSKLLNSSSDVLHSSFLPATLEKAKDFPYEKEVSQLAPTNLYSLAPGKSLILHLIWTSPTLFPEETHFNRKEEGSLCITYPFGGPWVQHIPLVITEGSFHVVARPSQIVFPNYPLPPNGYRGKDLRRVYIYNFSSKRIAFSVQPRALKHFSDDMDMNCNENPVYIDDLQIYPPENFSKKRVISHILHTTSCPDAAKSSLRCYDPSRFSVKPSVGFISPQDPSGEPGIKQLVVSFNEYSDIDFYAIFDIISDDKVIIHFSVEGFRHEEVI